jgi:hypothetical protein
LERLIERFDQLLVLVQVDSPSSVWCAFCQMFRDGNPSYTP